MKKKRAVVVGLDYHSQLLSDIMKSAPDWSVKAYGAGRIGTLRALWACRQADALICFGGPAPNMALVEAARRGNIPVFVIWAGSDIFKARTDPFHLEIIKEEQFIHLAVAPWLVSELAELGLTAEYMPVAAVVPGDSIQPLPKRFSVLTYLPEPRRDFYGADLVYEAARALPDISFNVVGAGGRDPHAPPNVTFHGAVKNMQKHLDAAVVLLRLPLHDGQSLLVVEALARARHVIWNYRFPAVRTVTAFDEAVAMLRHLRDRHAKGALELNHAGRRYALDHFARADIASGLASRLDAGVTSWASRPKRGRRRVAISGLGLFCAEISQFVKTYSPQWETRLLRTNSRLETLTSILTIATCDVWYSIGSPITDRWVDMAARWMRKPRVIHWVGSDIASLAEDASLRRMLAGPSITHLAEVAWTADQLRGLGFHPRIAPLPPRHPIGGPMPMPAIFTVMLYVPRTRTDFYGRRDFERLMHALSGKPISYIIVGGGEISVPHGVAAQNLGWRNSLSEVYERVSALIRFTPRDGLSLMVLEALSFGRHVLWTQDFPHTTLIRDFEGMKSEILHLFDAHMRGELKTQSTAADMIAKHYSPQKCTTEIAAAWDDALGVREHGPLAWEIS